MLRKWNNREIGATTPPIYTLEHLPCIFDQYSFRIDDTKSRLGSVGHLSRLHEFPPGLCYLLHKETDQPTAHRVHRGLLLHLGVWPLESLSPQARCRLHLGPTGG